MKKLSFFLLILFVLITGCQVQPVTENEISSDLILPVGNIVERLSFQSNYEEVETYTLKLDFVGKEPPHKEFRQEIKGSLEELMVSNEKFFIPEIPYGATLQIKLSVFVSSASAQNKLLYEGISEQITISEEKINVKIFMARVEEETTDKEPGNAGTETGGTGSELGSTGTQTGGTGTEPGNTGTEPTVPETISGPLYVSVWGRDSSDSTNGSFGVFDAFDESLSKISLSSVPDGEMPDDFVSDGKGTTYFGYIAINQSNVTHGFEIYRYADGNYTTSDYIWYVTTNSNTISVVNYDMSYDSDQNIIYVMISYSDGNTYIYNVDNPDTRAAFNSNPTKLLYNSAQEIKISGVKATQFAIYGDTVYLLHKESGKYEISDYNLEGNPKGQTFTLASEKVEDGYLQYGVIDYLSFPDIAANEKGVFVLAREVSDKVSKAEDFTNYSRGALIKLSHSLSDVSMTGWTSVMTKVVNTSNSNITNLASAYWPGPKGTGFWGPQRILGLKGNALVFADDGVYLSTTDKNYSYANTAQKNSIVIVNLSDMTITIIMFENSSSVQFDYTIST